MKKYSRNEFNFESVTNKFQSFSFFDQHVITWQCSLIVLEMLASFAAGIYLFKKMNNIKY